MPPPTKTLRNPLRVSNQILLTGMLAFSSAAVPAFGAVDCADGDLLDGDRAVNTIPQLREHAKNPGRPFFLAVGFANPHAPWIDPRTYFGLYDPAKLELAKNEFLPKGSPTFAATSGTDFYGYKDVPQVSGDKLPEDCKRACLQGYYAAIKYLDAQVGRLIAALDETGQAKNTVIVYWSDAAFSWYPKNGHLGVAMRTDQWRYVEWTNPGEPVERELFDITSDFQNDLNVADRPENAEVLAALGQSLRARFPVQEFKNPPTPALCGLGCFSKQSIAPHHRGHLCVRPARWNPCGRSILKRSPQFA